MLRTSTLSQTPFISQRVQSPITLHRYPLKYCHHRNIMPTTSPPMDDPTIMTHNPVAFQQPQPRTYPDITQPMASKPLRCALANIIAGQGPLNSSEGRKSHAKAPEDRNCAELPTGRMGLTVNENYFNSLEPLRLARMEGFSQLTSITAPSLLPWSVMCLPNLKFCSIGTLARSCTNWMHAVRLLSPQQKIMNTLAHSTPKQTADYILYFPYNC